MADTYTIKGGDTLGQLAKTYNTTVQALMEANPYITNANKIYAGKTLSLPGTQAVATAAAPAVSAAPAQTAESILSNVPTQAANTYGISQDAAQFTYDPSADASLQQYLKQGNASIMQDMANRGIVNSTTTSTQLAQLLGRATPEYEQAAYTRWSAEQDRALQRASFLQGVDQTAFSQDQALQDNAYTLSSYLSSLNDDDYATYKSEVAASQAERMANIQTVQEYYTQKSTELANAISSINSLGYADNDTALILGIGVGTTAAQAASAITAKQQELQNLQMQAAYLVSQNQQQSAVENQAMQLRNAYTNPAVLQTVSSPSTNSGGGDPLTSLWENVRAGTYNLNDAQVQQIGLLILNGADKNSVMVKINEFVAANTPPVEVKSKVQASSTGGKKIQMTK
jgi:LysM repeat protein